VANYHSHNPEYISKFNWAEKSKFYILADRVLWKDKLPYYEASWFNHSANTYGVDFLETVDRARDLRHPGSISAKIAAEKIAVGLKAKGLQ
jgi:hypothetical protein